ncbi:hypothetical protein [Kineococcus sp. SYSU DK006]|uniref:hypothetical protein n=1 Tax=Kineococcus sp. SYSU DK006 TaxID=3383127 RepID=UPI003D7ECD06
MTTRGRAAAVLGAGAAVLGALSWGFAVTSMSAVQAAEARALGPGHTSAVPGEDELALVAHDARLVALLVVTCGTGVLLTVLLAVRGRRGALSGWASTALALAVANTVLGRSFDGGSVLLAAGSLLAVAAAAACAGVLAAQLASARRPADRSLPARRPTAWVGLGSGLLAAGTLPVLSLQGTTSERYGPWIPADLVTATTATAIALAAVAAGAALVVARTRLDAVLALALPAAALVVLCAPGGGWLHLRPQSWLTGPVLALAVAPLLLGAAPDGAVPGTRRRLAAGTALGLLGALGALLPQLLALPVVVGGMLGLIVTGPAGAYVNYDGVPVGGGGLLIACALAVPVLVLRGGPEPAREPVAA